MCMAGVELISNFEDVTKPATGVFQRISVVVANDDDSCDTSKFLNGFDSPACVNKVGETNTRRGVEALFCEREIENISLSQNHTAGRLILGGNVQHGAGNVHGSNRIACSGEIPAELAGATGGVKNA